MTNSRDHMTRPRDDESRWIESRLKDNPKLAGKALWNAYKGKLDKKTFFVKVTRARRRLGLKPISNKVAARSPALKKHK